MVDNAEARAASAGSQAFNVIRVSMLESLDSPTRSNVFDIYRRAFAQRPYNENFTEEEAATALATILNSRGHLVIGLLGGSVVSIAGGCQKDEDAYFIGELAVAPEYQGQGYGRSTLDALLQIASAQVPRRLQVRTTVANARAINLYRSEGFAPESVTEAVAHRRTDGRISVDERLYLSKPVHERSTVQGVLRRMAVAYPSGNTTAIVFDQLLSADRKLLNESIMRSWQAANPAQPEIEQCCFLTPALNSEAVARVEMFGGEFCGNATRSAAWLITGGKDYSGRIEVSGAEKLLGFRVENGEVTAEMPLPMDGDPPSVVEEGTLVQLDGIAQLVITDADLREAITPRQVLESLVTGNKYGLADQSAVGVSYYDSNTGRASFCVWVNEVGTIFDETACGSGTCAIGVTAAMETQGPVRLPVLQPSGEVIITNADYDSAASRVVSSAISGRVNVLYDGGFVAK